MYNKEFAERLYKLRAQKNVSAREMSLDIGQNDSYINRIENSRTTFLLLKIRLLIKAPGSGPQYIPYRSLTVRRYNKIPRDGSV